MTARTTVTIVWKGVDVVKAMSDDIQAAINDTTAAAAISAKKSHPTWRNRTGTAEASIQMRPAVKKRGSWTGLFGSFDVVYFIWLEIGTRFRAGDFTIRRAADAEFPRVSDRLRALVSKRK